MIFDKPKNVSLSDMAIWIDSDPDCLNDTDKLVEYLYFLVFAKSKQCVSLADEETYDNFSLYCVSRLLSRMFNTKENKIKSISNYIKTIIVPWHAEYVREFCVGSPELNIENFNISDFSDYLIDYTSEYDYSSYSFNCLEITTVIKQYLEKIPKKRNSGEWSNIYVSCLLTIEDRIKSAIDLSSKNVAADDPVFLNRAIRSLKTKTPILYHLDDSKSTYISVLVNEIIHAISAELSRSLPQKVSVSSCLKNLVIAANNTEDE